MWKHQQYFFYVNCVLIVLRFIELSFYKNLTKSINKFLQKLNQKYYMR